MPTRPLESTASAMPIPNSSGSCQRAGDVLEGADSCVLAAPCTFAGCTVARCCASSVSAYMASCRLKHSDMSSVVMRESPM